MLMIQDGIEVYCLPDGACCEVDENHRSPLDLDDCPLGYETCTGNRFYYAEKFAIFEHIRSEILTKLN